MSQVKTLAMTRADQDDINRYSYLIYASNKLQRQSEDAKKQLDNQTDAQQELEVIELEGDDSSVVPVKIGSAYFHLPFALAKAQVEDLLKAARDDCLKYEQELTSHREELKSLKTRLEAKFGDAIRLE